MQSKDVDIFEKIKAQIAQLHSEVSLLSKGKPDNLINKFKLKFINEKLAEGNVILTGEFKPFKDFNVFEDAELPSNSDVVLVLSQYLDGLEAWRCANIRYSHVDGNWYWKLEDKTEIETQAPSRYRKI